tara:strand:+ start:367 stop:600 length:234 start_codon:yes stop_codon:yes gene_type:complete
MNSEKKQKLKKGMKKKLILLMMLLTGLMVQGCATTKLNNVEEMVEHPQFQDAAKAAPDWTKAVLKRLASLEYELERK